MNSLIAKNRSGITILLCFLTALFEGVDLQAAGVAAPHLIPLMKLNPAQAGQFFSASTLGLLIGAPVGGWLADRFGRKIMLITSIVIFGVFALATSLAGDFQSLVAVRLATGVGLGGALPNMIALASENTRAERRGLAVGLMYCGMPLGGALASLISLTGGADWKSIFYIGGGAPLLLAPVIALTLSESMRRLRVAGAPHPGLKAFLGALFGADRAVRTLLLWTGFGFTLLILYLLLNWLPSLLIGRGFSKPVAAMVQIAFNLGGVAGSIGVGWLIDGKQRGVVTIVSFALTIAFLTALAVMPAQPLIAIAIGGALGVGIMSNQAILYAIAPWCYPMSVRGAGIGAAVAVGRLGSLIGPLVAGQLVGSGHSASQVLLNVVPILVIGAAAALTLSFRLRGEAPH